MLGEGRKQKQMKIKHSGKVEVTEHFGKLVRSLSALGNRRKRAKSKNWGGGVTWRMIFRGGQSSSVKRGERREGV